MAAALRQILGVTFRWAGAWSILGLLTGIVLMLSKVELIAESGAKPFHLSAYAFWIPLIFGLASVFGLALGFSFACLMALTKLWLASTEIQPSLIALHATRLLCGAIAGGLIGWPLVRNEAAFIFAACGFASAVVSAVMNRRPNPQPAA